MTRINESLNTQLTISFFSAQNKPTQDYSTTWYKIWTMHPQDKNDNSIFDVEFRCIISEQTTKSRYLIAIISIRMSKHLCIQKGQTSVFDNTTSLHAQLWSTCIVLTLSKQCSFSKSQRAIVEECMIRLLQFVTLD